MPASVDARCGSEGLAPVTLNAMTNSDFCCVNKGWYCNAYRLYGVGWIVQVFEWAKRVEFKAGVSVFLDRNLLQLDLAT